MHVLVAIKSEVGKSTRQVLKARLKFLAVGSLVQFVGSGFQFLR